MGSCPGFRYPTSRSFRNLTACHGNRCFLLDARPDLNGEAANLFFRLVHARYGGVSLVGNLQ
jgi:hypothetical protein